MFLCMCVAGHDSTLMPLMAAILQDNWDGKWTPYAGMLIFEVYKKRGGGSAGVGSHLVRLLFRGKPLLVPGCADSEFVVCFPVSLYTFCALTWCPSVTSPL